MLVKIYQKHFIPSVPHMLPIGVSDHCHSAAKILFLDVAATFVVAVAEPPCAFRFIRE